MTNDNYFSVEIITCQLSKEIAEDFDTDFTPYTDVECKSDEEASEELAQSIYLVETMMIS